MCRHHGFHTPTSRYDRAAATLRFVSVCDECGEDVRLLDSLPYKPSYQSSSSSADRKRSFS
jgi:hypothetical protein